MSTLNLILHVKCNMEWNRIDLRKTKTWYWIILILRIAPGGLVFLLFGIRQRSENIDWFGERFDEMLVERDVRAVETMKARASDEVLKSQHNARAVVGATYNKNFAEHQKKNLNFSLFLVFLLVHITLYVPYLIANEWKIN